MKKYITFTFQIEKKLQELIKMEKELQKIYLTYYNLLIAQGLWQAHYHILSIIFLKEFIKVNVNMARMTKNVKLVKLHRKHATVFLNTQTLEML